MSSDTHSFYVTNVVVALYKLEASLADWDSTDTEQKAKTAVENFYQLFDYVWDDVKHRYLGEIPDLKSYRKKIWSGSLELELLSDCANVYKHKKISRQGALINRLDQIQFGYATVRLWDPNGYYFYNRKRVRIVTNSGALFDLADELRRCVASFDELLFIEQLIPERVLKPKAISYFRQRSECGELIEYWDGIAGTPFKRQLQHVDFERDGDRLIDSQYEDIQFRLETKVVMRVKTPDDIGS